MNQIIYESFVQADENEFELQMLISALQSMAVFCAQNIDWTDSAAESEVREVEFNFH